MHTEINTEKQWIELSIEDEEGKEICLCLGYNKTKELIEALEDSLDDFLSEVF